jgi:hypothetical protein
MRKLLRRTVTLAVVATAISLVPALVAHDARADYNVYQLDASRGVGQSGWVSFGDGGFYRLDYGSYLQVTGLYNGNYTPAGNWAIWRTPGLPGNLYIDSASYESSGSAQSGRALGAGLCTDAEPYHLYCAQDWLLYIPYNDNSWTARVNNRAGSKFFKMMMGCGNSCPATTWTNGAVRNMAFTMRDVDGPSSGYAADSGVDVWGGWTSGTKDVRVWSTDGTSGVEHATVYFDGNPGHPLADTKFAPCNRVSGGYSSFVPCPTGAAMIHDVDTTQLTDGPHTLQHVTYDTSGNAYTNSQSFKVDNTDPAKPESVDVTTDTAAGWQSTNSFAATWVNTGENTETSTQSGLEQTCYDVDPADATASGLGVNPPAACTGSTDSLSNVSVPGDGSWDVHVRTVDRAGNTSESETVQFNLDTTLPDKAAGVANGWIAKKELADGFSQEWDLPSNYNEIHSGVCGYAFSITQQPVADPGTSIDVVGDATSAQLPANLTEGDWWSHFRPISCAGVPSAEVEHVYAPVDLTDPASSIEGVAHGQWFNGDASFTLHGMDALSGMAPSTDSGPGGHKKGAYLPFHLDSDPIGDFHRGNQGTTTVTTEGEHELRYSAVDFAGNRATDKVIRFGVDRTKPAGAFAIPDPDRPTLIELPATDSLSGIGSASIEIRAERSNDRWRELDTAVKAGGTAGTVTGKPNTATLVARFPDTSLARGNYEVRAVIHDVAGNQFVQDKRVDGAPMRMSNPMRRGVTVSAGLSKAKRSCKKVKRNRCVKRKKGRVYRVGTSENLTVSFKRGAYVSGVLVDGKYKPLSRQPIEIYGKALGQPERLLTTTVTKSDGSYDARISPGESRVVRVYYPGTETIEDSTAIVRLGTMARVTLKLSKHHVRTGQTLVFTGRVTPFDKSRPISGKIVQIQFFAKGKWRLAAKAARTDANGRFKVKYRFDGPRVKGRIVFRANLPSQADVAHATSVSGKKTVKLN